VSLPFAPERVPEIVVAGFRKRGGEVGNSLQLFAAEKKKKIKVPSTCAFRSGKEKKKGEGAPQHFSHAKGGETKAPPSARLMLKKKRRKRREKKGRGEL